MVGLYSNPSCYSGENYVENHMNEKPAWVEALLCEKFFTPCGSHSSSKKNERNIFCLDCTMGICQHCLPNHSHHKLIQIRRYVYHDVIRIEDIQKMVDCTHVQPYIINSAKVVFLNQRPQPRPTKGPGYNPCKNCERGLQDTYKYCSMGCKVEAVMRHGEGPLQALFPRVYNAKRIISDLLACMLEEELKECMDVEHSEQRSPNSTLSGLVSCTPSTSSGSTIHDDLVSRGEQSDRVAKKPRIKTSDQTSISFSSVSMKRRKSTPHRSPIS